MKLCVSRRYCFNICIFDLDYNAGLAASVRMCVNECVYMCSSVCDAAALKSVSSCSLCIDAMLLGMSCFCDSVSKIKGCFIFA